MFYTGQRVVCINDDFPEGDCQGGRVNRPVKDRVYTVRDVLKWTWGNWEVSWAVRLFELKNPRIHWKIGGYNEIPFSAHRFRPMDERKTNISVFTDILRPVKEDA